MSGISQASVAAVRRFNRFYTREAGVLRKSFLDSPFTLGEARVLLEIAHGCDAATDLAGRLDLDLGYVSRMLQRFEAGAFIARTRSETDARRAHLALTAKGRRAFDEVDARQNAATSAMLARLKPKDRARLIAAMETIEELLGAEAGMQEKKARA